MMQWINQPTCAVILHQREDGEGLTDQKFPRFSHAAICVSLPVETAMLPIEQRLDEVRISVVGSLQVIMSRIAVTETVCAREYPKDSRLRYQAAQGCYTSIILARRKQGGNHAAPGLAPNVRCLAAVEQLIASGRTHGGPIPIRQRSFAEKRVPSLCSLCSFGWIHE